MLTEADARAIEGGQYMRCACGMLGCTCKTKPGQPCQGVDPDDLKTKAASFEFCCLRC